MDEEEIRILEQINAKIDVLIDEERYSEIDKEIILDIDLSECFKHPNCTKDTESAWHKLLSRDSPSLQLRNAKASNDEWIRLFYAKMLRLKIQQSGTDCYFNRLDQLVNYLEKYIPNPHDNIEKAKLSVLYLLELSAITLTYESMGFSERARRVINDQIDPQADKNDKNFTWFYERLISFNNGIAHFHLSNYRDAVLEFNDILYKINELRKSKDHKDRLDFYNKRSGDSLLFYPAIIYRAEIQLKQQLAYHALKTLAKYSSKLDKERYKYLGYKADLIKIQAYQLLEDLKASAYLIKGLWKELFKVEQSFPYFSNLEKMISAKAFVADMSLGTEQQNIKGRLISLAIDQHLNCLRIQKEAILREETETNVKHEKLTKWVDNHLNYLTEIGQKSFVSYFLAVEFEELDRQGYWEQVADFLGWIAEIKGELKHYGTGDKKKVIQKISAFCYESIGISSDKKLLEYMLEKPPSEVNQQKWDCRWCNPKGISLRRLPPNHYSNFVRNMMKVLEAKLLDVESKQHEDFVKRLLLVEEYRGDLRIKDLELRYKSNEVIEALPPNKGNSWAYCWPDRKMAEKFELLPCGLNQEDIEKLEAPIIQSGTLHPHRRYEQIMETWDDHFFSHLESPSLHEKQEPGLYFLGLQRWNSSSPAEGYSLGGGYLIYNLDENCQVSYGIAIDPGFDFVRNLFHMGFSLNDIDIIIISHAHIDHIRDFESIVTLLLELKKRKNINRKVHVILTLGTYKRLEYIIENPQLRMHIEPYIIDIDREIDTDYFESLPDNKISFYFNICKFQHNGKKRRKQVIKPAILNEDNCKIKIYPKQAYHDDYTQYSDSFGFVIKIHKDEEKEISIGYTGDTKWIYNEINDPIKGERVYNNNERVIKDITSQYKDCETLIVHLGSIIKEESGKYDFLRYWACEDKDECEKLVRKEGHPYLIGLLRILTSLYNNNKVDQPLVFVSEFGEELRGKIRVDLIKRLFNIYGEKMEILPVDVGINVQLQHQGKSNNKKKIFCVQCERLLPISEADFEHYGQDEAIFCVCKTCLVGTPFDVLQNRLRQLYEVGYELHAAKR